MQLVWEDEASAEGRLQPQSTATAGEGKDPSVDSFNSLHGDYGVTEGVKPTQSADFNVTLASDDVDTLNGLYLLLLSLY